MKTILCLMILGALVGLLVTFLQVLPLLQEAHRAMGIGG